MASAYVSSLKLKTKKSIGLRNIYIFVVIHQTGFFFLMFILFLFSPETECEQGRGRERGRENPRQAPCCQHRAQHGAQSHEL